MSNQDEKVCFISALMNHFDKKYVEILERKQEKKWLEYLDAQIISHTIKNIYLNALDCVPKQVDAMLMMSEATLAPTKIERMKLIKGAISVGGGAGGIGLIVYSVVTAMGIGVGVATPGLWATIQAFFVGTAAVSGPIGWIVAGIAGGTALAVFAGYFAFSGSPLEDTERYCKVLKAGIKSTTEAIWPEYGDRLALAYTQGQGQEQNFAGDRGISVEGVHGRNMVQ
jgi:hypothetical protein